MPPASLPAMAVTMPGPSAASSSQIFFGCFFSGASTSSVDSTASTATPRTSSFSFFFIIMALPPGVADDLQQHQRVQR